MDEHRFKVHKPVGERYMLALTSSYTAVPSGDLTEVAFYMCKRCGATVIEHGPNVEGRMVHDLWHVMVPGLEVPDA